MKRRPVGPNGVYVNVIYFALYYQDRKNGPARNRIPGDFKIFPEIVAFDARFVPPTAHTDCVTVESVQFAHFPTVGDVCVTVTQTRKFRVQTGGLSKLGSFCRRYIVQRLDNIPTPPSVPASVSA